MIKNFKDNIFLYVLSILSLFTLIVFLFPALKLNYLLIDDGQIIRNARIISEDFLNFDIKGNKEINNILFEKSEGRVRPFYWLTQSFFVNIFNGNIQALHLVRIVFLALTLYLLYKILDDLKIKKQWIYLSLFFYTFNFQNFENYYRLGPTEIFLGLYFVYILYVLFKDNIKKYDYALSILALIFGIFTKETFFLCFIPVLYLLLNKNIKNKKHKFSVLISSLFFGLLVLKIKSSYGIIEGYSQNYVFNVNTIYSNFINYFKQINHYQTPMLYVYIVYTIYFILSKIRRIFVFNKEESLFTFLCCVIFINLIVLLPWQYVLGRYLTIINLSLVICYALILNEIGNAISANKIFALNEKSFNIILLLLLPVMFVRNLFQIGNFQQWQDVDSKLTTDLLRTISENTPKNQTIYANFKKGDSNIEIFLETKWHLEEFYNRPDINLEYLEVSDLCKKEEVYILDRSSDRLIEKESLKLLSKSIGSNEYTYKPIVYGEVLKSFINGSKSENWNLNYNFDWKVYIKGKDECIKL